MTDKERYESLLADLKELIEKHDCKCIKKDILKKINTSDKMEVR